ncbi:MAG TPA: sulfatase [Opitutae bacterium]|nr:sulfatase [Opitutae bacterium]
MKHVLSLLLSFFLTGLIWAKKPNVVFLVSEDNSVHYLKHYGAKFGSMPHVEKMAEEGLTFNHAFSNGPVCSVARSTLATGILAPRGGFQYHRKSALANGIQPWSAILKQAGYYCANNRKTDYNFSTGKGEAWNESSSKATWRKRSSPEQPFFYMQSFAVCHESSLHFSEKTMRGEKTKTPVDQVAVHPYHPDTPTFRYTLARYFDRMRLVDEQMGELLNKLKADGLIEDTFVFYFGDHGGVLPRGKGYAYESGLHVPLVVRIPENFRKLVDHKRGTRTDGFVSFIDFGPTVLNLAGLPVPRQMDGSAFLGKGTTANELASRDEAFGYADRFDEKYDLVRTLRKGKWKYVRNYHGFYPDGLQNNYRYRMLAFQEWRNLFHKGVLNEAQSQFFKARPPEQLFDLSTDPHEVKDLSTSPAHQSVLIELRGRLRNKLKEINDLSFYPESHLVEEILADPIAYGKKHSKEIAQLVDLADLAILPYRDAERSLQRALEKGSAWEKYWACVVCSHFGEKAKSAVSALQALEQDRNLMVRMRAVEALALVNGQDPIPQLVRIANQSSSAVEVLLTLNAVTFFRDHHGFALDVKSLKVKAPQGQYLRRTEYFAEDLNL